MAKKILCSVVSFILCAVIAFVSCYFAIPDFNAWVKGQISDIGSDNENNDGNNGGSDNMSFENGGGAIVSDIENYGVSVLSAMLPFSAYDANGISEQTETAYLLTAVITPDSATNKVVQWNIAWSNPESEFANGKEVTDYVTVTPTSSGALTANLECRQAFGEHIIITVVSDDNPDIKAICTVDYVQKVENVTLKFGNFPINLGGITEFKFEVNPNGVGCGGVTDIVINKGSVYTIEDTFTYDISLSYLTTDLKPGKSTDTNLQFFGLKGLNFVGMVGPVGSLNSCGYDFDYEDICELYYPHRTASKEVYLRKLSTSEIISYFSDITNGYFASCLVSVVGEHSNYETYSVMKCVGYTNQASVNGVDIDKGNVIF